MPSPTIATRGRAKLPKAPADCNRLIAPALSSGNTSAMTRSMPTCLATASALRWLSPVIITMSRPSWRSSAIASLAPGFTVSATAMTPIARPSSATAIAVFPAACSRSRSASSPARATPWASISLGLPTMTAWPATEAWTPKPPSAWNCRGSSRRNPLSRAALTMARPKGCSEPRSALAARLSSSSEASLSTATTSVSSGSPRVMVPVLSSATTLTWPARSSVSLFLKRMPFSAPLVVPTMIAVGVARPMAQGQAMTSTAMALIIAAAQPIWATQIHPRNVASAAATMIGTNHLPISSVSFWMGALLPCASCTSLAIWASVVSLPTFVASNLIKPSRLTVAPMTSSPGPLLTGIGSPVIIASSNADRPSQMIPSTGTFPPGRTNTVSPTFTSSTPISASTPPRSTQAVLARSPIRALNASEVLPLARVSRYLPSLTRVMMAAPVSKYTLGLWMTPNVTPRLEK